MIKTRLEMAQLLNVTEKYLCPSNFSHVQQGAKKIGYNLIKMEGKGKNALYYIEKLKEQEDLPNEIWKEIPVAPGYQASTLGRIKHPNGYILPQTLDYGYSRVTVKGMKMRQPAVHRLIMLTFKPIENPEIFMVDHINGIRSDNRLENLRWVFQDDNVKLGDINNTEIKEIIPQLIQKFGYEETKQKLLKLLND